MLNHDKSLELLDKFLQSTAKEEIEAMLKNVSSQDYEGITLDQYLEVFSESYNYDFILNQNQLDILTDEERNNSREFSYSEDFTSDLKIPPSVFLPFGKVENNFVSNPNYSIAA